MRARFLRIASALGVVLFLVYSANGREIGAGDTVPGILLPVAILRGDGFVLERFNRLGWWDPKALPYAVAAKRGHLVPRYPVAPSLLAVPFTAPQLAWLDWTHPGWEGSAAAPYWLAMMGKRSAAAIGALVGVALYAMLSTILARGSMALVATVIATLGSTLWMYSQSIWQHGPAALALIIAIALLLAARAGSARLGLAGLAAAAFVCFRPPAVAIFTMLFGWVIWRYRVAALWFLPFPLLLGSALVGTNYWYFGTAVGGYRELFAEHFALGTIKAVWSPDLLGGAAGTLLSPNRGLFVFSPWIPLALAALPATASRLRPWPVGRVALWALVPFLCQQAAFAEWWGGWSFGPRLWTEVVPLFAIPLGLALEWSWDRYRLFFVGLLLTGLFAIGVQAIGAFYFPSSWNAGPPNVVFQPARVWDWRDTELRRCLAEGPQAWPALPREAP